jgi:hypothetical protein
VDAGLLNITIAKELVVKSDEQQMQTPSATTQNIEEDQWIKFLDEFTRQNRGAHARLEILGPDVGSQLEAENRPFGGISADTKAGEHNVSITFGSSAEDHLERGIQNVTGIWLRPATGHAGPTLEVLSRDGTRALLELSRADAYALPFSAL